MAGIVTTRSLTAAQPPGPSSRPGTELTKRRGSWSTTSPGGSATRVSPRASLPERSPVDVVRAREHSTQVSVTHDPTALTHAGKTRAIDVVRHALRDRRSGAESISCDLDSNWRASFPSAASRSSKRLASVAAHAAAASVVQEGAAAARAAIARAARVRAAAVRAVERRAVAGWTYIRQGRRRHTCRERPRSPRNRPPTWDGGVGGSQGPSGVRAEKRLWRMTPKPLSRPDGARVRPCL
jgi:hypothetical protein